jgi:glycosyltransferase involved in cell wall biosynthesis
VKPDIAIGMMTTAAIVVAIAGLGLRGVVRIGAERSYPPSLPLNRLWRYLRKAVFGLLDEVVVQTADGAEWIRKNTWASKVTVIPNGIPWPMPVFEPRLEPPAKEAQQRHLIAVGRLRPEKQFDQLINVFARLAERFSNWNLMIVGDGPLGPQLSQQVHMLGLQDRILIPGRVGNVSDWYQSADLAALTSEFEGFPNVLLEAMACGLPAVSYDCLTGPSDIISQGKNGLLVPVGDQAALEEALGYLMADDQARLTLSKNAVAVKERFSEPKVFSQWELLFESHVGTRGG